MPSYEQAARRVLERADELATFTEEPGRITRPLLTPAMARRRRGCASGWRRRGSRRARTRSATSPGAAAGAGLRDRLAPGLGGRRRPLRRHPRHPRRARGRRGAARRAARGRGLRRRGRPALPEHLPRQPRLRRRARPGGLALRDARRRDAARGDRRRRSARRCYAPAHARATSRSTSSRDRCSRPRACRSASSPRSPARAASTSSSRATPATPGRRRCTCAATPPRPPPSSCSPPSGSRRAEPGLVATVGELDVPRGAVNVIPGRADVTLDIRHQDDAVREAAIDALRAEADAIGARRGVAVAWSTISAAARHAVHARAGRPRRRGGRGDRRRRARAAQRRRPRRGDDGRA